jgi:hypothetical protein
LLETFFSLETFGNFFSLEKFFYLQTFFFLNKVEVPKFGVSRGRARRKKTLSLGEFGVSVAGRCGKKR